MKDWVEVVEQYAAQRGLEARREGGRIVVGPRDTPVFVAVEETGRGVRVYISHKGLRDYIREVVDTEDKPREYIEELLDDLTAIAYGVAQELRSKGFQVVLETRDAVMDVLEEVEEALEEEE